MRSAAAILLAAIALAGCGGSGDGDGAAGVPDQLDAPIQLADCTDWEEGSVQQRLGTIRQIHTFVGGPVPGTGGTGVTLDDEKAYDLFEEACSHSVAQGFTLYKIYVRAAAFNPELRAEQPEN